MKNPFYKLDEMAFLKLSKALKNPTYENVMGTMLGIKEKLLTEPLPMTAEQLAELEKLGIIHDCSQEEWELERDGLWKAIVKK